MIDAQTLAAGLFAAGFKRAPVRPVEVDDLSAFKVHVYRQYERARHLDLLDSYLMQVTEYIESGGARGIGRLIVTMPPRHGKSLTVSGLYPVWHLGRNPRHAVMLATYGQSLSNKNSRKARGFLRSKKYLELFPRTRLSKDSASVTEWTIAGTDEEGGMAALGIGGAATGKGAHLLVVDDPFKNRAEAESETYRNKIYDGFNDDLLTRLEPGGAVVVLHTRWHEDDLIGRLLRDEPGRWVVLNLPALAEEGDLMGRASGEALWPERYPVADLLDKKRTMSPYSWVSLYQQRPRPAEGGILKKDWFKRIPAILEADVVKRVRYWDLAMSSKTSADFTVGLLLAELKNGEHVIEHIARGQVELADLPTFLKSVMLKDGDKVRQGFEKAGYMTRAIQELAKDAELRRFTITGYPVDTDKLTRALPAAARAYLGMLHIMDEPFASVALEEFASFPYGAHDDQVDALSGAWYMMSEKVSKIRVGIEAGRYA